jgi:hypothetical protein
VQTITATCTPQTADFDVQITTSADIPQGEKITGGVQAVETNGSLDTGSFPVDIQGPVIGGVTANDLVAGSSGTDFAAIASCSVSGIAVVSS